MQQGVAPRGSLPDGRGRRRGASICGWVLQERLREGPVSESWLALREERSAVVRVLRAPFAQDTAASAAWRSASWAANRFLHARVARVLDEGTDDGGAPVVVRRWAKGRSLEDVVRASPLDATAALRVIEQLLDALEMSHAHGIVHGALTPSNVVVTPRGSMRLVDFATPQPGRGEPSTGDKALGAARQSPFTAPERRTPSGSMGQAPIEASDVWSAGACLFFSLSGRAPDADLRSLGLDGDLAAVVALAISPDPADRYESAYAMLGDVRRLRAGQKPRLETALSPVPSQSFGGWRPPRVEPAEPSSSSQTPRLGSAATAAPPNARRERLGNLVLLLAIAVLAGAATFVVIRERQGDARRSAVPPTATGP
jgi:serine/threonine-protein kinase